MTPANCGRLTHSDFLLLPAKLSFMVSFWWSKFSFFAYVYENILCMIMREHDDEVSKGKVVFFIHLLVFVYWKLYFHCLLILKSVHRGGSRGTLEQATDPTSVVTITARVSIYPMQRLNHLSYPNFHRILSSSVPLNNRKIPS